MKKSYDYIWASTVHSAQPTKIEVFSSRIAWKNLICPFHTYESLVEKFEETGWQFRHHYIASFLEYRFHNVVSYVIKLYGYLITLTGSSGILSWLLLAGNGT